MEQRSEIVIHPGRLSAGERREAARLRRAIRDRGWALSRGCVDIEGRHHEVRYTAGLTRHHGHPELIVVGPPIASERPLLQGLVDHVTSGETLEPCWITFGSRSLALVAVDQPEVLWLTHLIYGVDGHPVSALQIVTPDDRGRWPWAGGDGALLGEWPFA